MSTATAAPGLADQVRGLIAQADPGSLLGWWGAYDRLPTGADPAPALSQAQFEGAYFLIENAATTAGLVRPMAAVAGATRDVRPDGPLPVAIASYRLLVPRPEVAASVRAAAEAGHALDPAPPSLADAIEPRRFFAAAALLHDQWGRAVATHRGRDLSLVVSPAFLLAAPGDPPPDRIEADLGDGFRDVAMGAPFGATFPEGDSATVAIRCTYGNERVVARFTVALSDDPAPPAPDETWALRGATEPGGGDGGARPGNTGRAYVFRAPGHAEVVNPVVLVEGFPGGHPLDYLYELFDQAGTVGALHARGYDVVIVGLDQGGDLIQRNAAVVEDCVRKALERTSAPLVVGGVSMGGIVARLALARMEARGADHGTRLYVSIDSPHRGAYTSLGVQWFVHTVGQFAPGLRTFAQVLDAPSNQQMMIAWLHDGVAGVSPLRERLLADLEAVGGYPRRPRRIAVSCGRGDGEREAAAGAATLTWSGEPFVSATLRTLPGGSRRGPVAEGSWFLAQPGALAPLEVEGLPAWEGAPGGQATYNGQVAAITGGIGCGTATHDLDQTCSVPTVSALDLDQDADAPIPPAGDAGPFHAHVCSAANELHLTITPAVRDWLLSELGDPPMQASPTAATAPAAWDPASFDPHDPGYLADPEPTYALFREHAPVHLVPQFGSYWVFRHADVHAVLDDTETFVKVSPKPGPPPPGPLGAMGYFGRGLFSSDPPRHDALRAILGPLFHQAIAGADERAAATAGAVLQGLAGRGRFELVTDYALPVPAGVLFDVLGIPGDKWVRQGLLAWQGTIVAAHDNMAPLGVQVAGATARMALHTYLMGYVAMARQTPQPGVIGGMCQAIGNGLTEVDVALCAADFVIAGYLSTTYLIASGLHRLTDNPDQFEALRADPGARMPGAVKEMLRYDAPAQLVDRVAAVDTSVGGVALKAGDKVCCVLGSADHDAAAFDAPEEFRVDRDFDAEPHITFGAGIHTCIGAPLVGLVAPAAMRALLDLPGLAVDGIPQWQSDPYLRGMLNLPVRVG